ncbi:MAG: caspase family protein [Flavobacteriales bacterium]|nr:caspase family protein [Flavobacteriales bacterium]
MKLRVQHFSMDSQKQNVSRLGMLIAFLLGSFFLSMAQNKHALIVAIGDYPEDSDWRDISSVNDIPLITEVLQKQGFESSNIRVLKNEEADKEAILAALSDMARNVSKGDIVFVHFSSHGQQIMDNENKDELDGYDEAIVAYGAPAYYDPLYKGENHLRDEELGSALSLIRQKLGSSGDLMLVVDACHSGTATRGKEIARGGKPPFAPKDYKPGEKSDDIGMFEDSPQSRGTGDQSPMVVFSASKSDEVNYEYDGFGSLSVAINRSFNKLKPGMSYRALFAEVLKEMSVIAPNQTPAIEGEIDRELFGGKAVFQEPYYVLESIRKNNEVFLLGGILNGLHEETELSFYPAGTQSKDQAAPLAKGSVRKAESTWSIISLDAALPGKATDYWAFVTKQTYGDIRLDMDISSIKEPYLAVVKNWISTFDLIEESTSGDPDLVIDITPGAGSRFNIDLFEGSSMELMAQYKNQSDLGKVEERVKQKIRGDFVKNLELSDPSLDVRFEFIPLRVENGEVKDTLNIQSISKAGMMEISASTMEVAIRVTNLGKRKAFFNIIDIQPDGAINGILPDPEQRHDPYEFQIGPGESRIVDGYRIEFGEPYGTELFKLFATEEPVDFSPIITQQATRGSKNPMEALFDESYSVSHRGGKSKVVVSSDMNASTHNVTFKIVP